MPETRETRKASYDVFLDLRGLTCPMPLVRTRQALMLLSSGATVCALSTDPGSKADFEAFCAAAGHRLIRNEQAEGVFLFVIEKA
jgi:tRNA 2-thiouridine synthesizing protein A